MDMETVISRIRKPSRSASCDCRPRRLRAAWRGCRPGAAGHDMRWNLSLKWRARSDAPISRQGLFFGHLEIDERGLLRDGHDRDGPLPAGGQAPIRSRGQQG